MRKNVCLQQHGMATRKHSPCAGTGNRDGPTGSPHLALSEEAGRGAASAVREERWKQNDAKQMRMNKCG